MGQVPAVKDNSRAGHDRRHNLGHARILVIGDGRLASTLLKILQERAPALGDCFARWSRRSAVSFSETLSTFDATHIWLAIADDAITGFAHEHRALLETRTVVHFAGSLSSFEFVHAAHPLTSFASSASLMTFSEFSKVPFILDQTAPELSELLPGFTNPAYRLDPQQRAYYHSLCAISGNFTVLLWETVTAKFEQELGLPRTVLDNYRSRIFENLANAANGETVLTGPMARRDLVTIQKHRTSLLERYQMPLLKIYDGFLDLYRTVHSPNTAKVPSKRSKHENGS